MIFHWVANAYCPVAIAVSKLDIDTLCRDLQNKKHRGIRHVAPDPDHSPSAALYAGDSTWVGLGVVLSPVLCGW